MKLKKYGKILCDVKSKEVYDKIKIQSEKGNVEIDLDGVDSFQTTFTQNVFGKLYVEMGNKEYYTKIRVIGGDTIHRMLINIGIERAIQLDEYEKLHDGKDKETVESERILTDYYKQRTEIENNRKLFGLPWSFNRNREQYNTKLSNLFKDTIKKLKNI